MVFDKMAKLFGKKKFKGTGNRLGSAAPLSEVIIRYLIIAVLNLPDQLGYFNSESDGSQVSK
jgi:hypothetical protein